MVFMKKLNSLDWKAIILLVVGGSNCGLVGLFNFDLATTIFGEMSVLSRVVYILVGISAIYVLIIASKLEKE